MNRPKVFAIVGPTCTGKTALSIALSKELGGEVIACDSRTIYRYMDIGTAKPTVEERQGIPHHMFDVADPDEIYTAALYKERATSIVGNVLSRGLVPIVCGGTGLYARALLEGLSIPAVAPQEDLRHQLNEQADRDGNIVLHQRLRELDPVTADRLGVNDRFRIIRALEVSITAGKPFSQLAVKEALPFRVIWIGLTYRDRELLREAIIQRLDEQIRMGLISEVAELFERYGRTRTLMNTVTYKEFLSYHTGEMQLEQSRAECISHNYQLARRQIMWFRANPEMNWLHIDELCKSDLHRAVSNLASSS